MNCHPEIGHLSNRVKNTLGTQPITLGTFLTPERELHVFAASDRTTIIYSVRQRLVFAGIKLRVGQQQQQQQV